MSLRYAKSGKWYQKLHVKGVTGSGPTGLLPCERGKSRRGLLDSKGALACLKWSRSANSGGKNGRGRQIWRGRDEGGGFHSQREGGRVNFRRLSENACAKAQSRRGAKKTGRGGGGGGNSIGGTCRDKVWVVESVSWRTD